jgi:hypothetical protein
MSCLSGWVWLSVDTLHHGCEMVLVFCTDILKLQTNADTRQDIAHSSFGDDAAIFDKKVKLDAGVNWQDLLGLDEDAADTDIANTRSVFATATAPIGPNALGSINSLVLATRMKDLLFHAAVPKLMSLAGYVQGRGPTDGYRV